MRNPCLEIALRELEAVGIRDVEQVRGGKHWQLRWQVNGHGLRFTPCPAPQAIGDRRTIARRTKTHAAGGRAAGDNRTAGARATIGSAED